ncbi:hypothetical protein K469DRAFT_758380 [Zopfia rhizophila CBS 207.26]|uniref:Uncharacterized protein n=1 Tax=Zopfia rhizophila CBS 207.26 TaxID=1314779 RepID=A0A6A6EWS2_9PEZI|nr:hypothetical protein K469DRAFT_758380 [Zopfia rhizophila CBS 207.26]
MEKIIVLANPIRSLKRMPPPNCIPPPEPHSSYSTTPNRPSTSAPSLSNSAPPNWPRPSVPLPSLRGFSKEPNDENAISTHSMCGIKRVLPDYSESLLDGNSTISNDNTMISSSADRKEDNKEAFRKGLEVMEHIKYRVPTPRMLLKSFKECTWRQTVTTRGPMLREDPRATFIPLRLSPKSALFFSLVWTGLQSLSLSRICLMADLKAGREKLPVANINSQQVKLVNDIREYKDQFDLESILIEVDYSFMASRLVRFQIIIQNRNAPQDLDETRNLFEVMMEDVRILCYRSVILSRMSTRERIITSKDIRYGVNNGSEFTTLTTRIPSSGYYRSTVLCEKSWIVQWLRTGIRNSLLFCNHQYGGHDGMRTFNDIPPIKKGHNRRNDNSLLNAILMDGRQFLIRAVDYEAIVCLTKGIYTVQEAGINGPRYDLIIEGSP